jgi:hypothetical protein
MPQAATAERPLAEQAWALVDRINHLGQGLHPDTFIDRRNAIGRDLAALARSLRPRSAPLALVSLGGLSLRERRDRAGPFTRLPSAPPRMAVEANAVFGSPMAESAEPKLCGTTAAQRRARFRRHRYPLPPRLCQDQLALL